MKMMMAGRREDADQRGEDELDLPWRCLLGGEGGGQM